MAEFNKLPGGSETILIVDDHETIWDFLIEALQELGYSVLLAENGLDAVEIFRENPGVIDLVLLDMIMPNAADIRRFIRSANLIRRQRYCFPADMFRKMRCRICCIRGRADSFPSRTG